VLVKLFSASDLGAVAGDYGLQPAPLDQFGSRPIYRMQIMDAEPPPDKAAALTGDSRVEYAEPNYFNSTPEGSKRSSWARVEDESNYADQWAAGKIRLAAAHTVARGAGVKVAVLDTGIDGSHPLLAGKLVSGYDFVDMDADPSEVGVAGQDIVFGHGTHVAGIVAVTAPDAKIMPVRVLDRNGEGNIWVLAEALGYAVNPDGDFATDDGAQVINLSLSTIRRTSLLAEIVGLVVCVDDDDDEDNDGDSDNGNDSNDDGGDVDNAGRARAAGADDDDDCLSRQGAVVVAAAGNNGSVTQEYPAGESISGLLAVAATTAADGRAAFSNHGSWVTMGAPGESIVSAIPGNLSGAWSGTSMASPFVAGTAALVKSHNPPLSPVQVAQQIVTTAVAIDSEVRLRVDAAAALGIAPEAAAEAELYLPFAQAGPADLGVAFAVAFGR
jgi:subtilisin family serine protease